MRKLLVLLALLACFVSSPGQADNARVVATCGTVPQAYQPGSQRDVTQDVNGNLCTAASVSASIAGFAPGGNFANLTATNVSASVALPSGAVVAFFNTGTTAVSCTLGIGSATATANQNIIQASSWMAFTVGTNTFGACIDQTGSASNVVVLSGGSGIPTGSGGGGGGSGGSVTQGTTPWVDSITTWGGGTLGAMANYGTSPGAVLVPGVNSFITNIPAVTQSGNWTSRIVGNAGGVLDSVLGAATPANAVGVGFTDGTNLQLATVTSAAMADGTTPPTSKLIEAQNFNMIWNGATWDRAQGITLGPGIDTASLPVLSPTPSSSATVGITPVVCGSAVSSCVLKASAGNLFGVYAECSATCWLMVFNSTTAPSNGATTAGVASGNLVECVPIAAGGIGSVNYGSGPPAVYTVGMTAAISSTTCATLTLATTGFIHGQVK